MSLRAYHAERAQLPVMKGRGHQPALAPPVLALGGQQALAEHHADALVGGAAAELLVALEQDLADGLGPVDDDEVEGAEAQAEDVTLLAAAAAHELEHVGAQLVEVAEHRQPRRGGREPPLQRRLGAPGDGPEEGGGDRGRALGHGGAPRRA